MTKQPNSLNSSFRGKTDHSVALTIHSFFYKVPFSTCVTASLSDLDTEILNIHQTNVAISVKLQLTGWTGPAHR